MRAGRLAVSQLSQMTCHVPGPEFDDMAARISDVGGAPATVAISLVIVVSLGTATGQLLSEPPAIPKISDFAPAGDLLHLVAVERAEVKPGRP